MIFLPKTSNPLYFFPSQYALKDCLMQHPETTNTPIRAIKSAARYFANSHQLTEGVEHGASLALENPTSSTKSGINEAQQKLVKALLHCARSSNRARH